MKTAQGFTLIELLVVIAIIGLLSSVVLASLNSARIKGNDSRRIQEMVEIQKAVEAFNADYGHYPDTGGTWTSFDSPTFSGNPIGGTPSASNLTSALTAYIGKVSDPRTATIGGAAGVLFWGTANDYCILTYLTPENMNNYKASQIGTGRCGTISNGQCSGVNNAYIGIGSFTGGC